MKRYVMDGFVIIPPLNSWDDQSKVIPLMSYRSFGKTLAEAWSTHIQRPYNDPDWSIIVQRWHDRGFRVKKATLTIEDE